MRSKRTYALLTAVVSVSIGCTGAVDDVGAASEALRCSVGYVDIGGRCDIATPRRISPLSGALVSADSLALEFEMPAGVDRAIVEICADSRCSAVSATYSTTDERIVIRVPQGPTYWRMRGGIGTRVSAWNQPPWPVRALPSPAPVWLSLWGKTLDGNGDGYADLAVAEADTGRVHVYYGGPSGISSTPSLTIVAPGGGGAKHETVTGAGDVNGDGTVDLIVGAWRRLVGGVGVGELLVYHGTPTGLSSTPATHILGDSFGLAGNITLGWSATSIGDLDHDGYADIAVGAPGAANSHGRVFVYRGSAQGIVPGTHETLSGSNVVNGNFGSALAGGDVNLDGYGDLVVGECLATWQLQQVSGANEVHLYLGGPSGLTHADTITGAPGSGFGCSVAITGDRNGDGYPDVVAGAYNVDTQDGEAYVYAGGNTLGALLETISTQTQDGFFGYTVDGCANVDGDSDWDEIVIAETDTNGGAGRVYLSYEAGQPLVAIDSPVAGPAYFGQWLTMVGDMNGDFRDDLVVGASDADRAYVYPGAAGGPSATPSVTLSGPAGSRFGIPGR